MEGCLTANVHPAVGCFTRRSPNSKSPLAMLKDSRRLFALSAGIKSKAFRSQTGQRRSNGNSQLRHLKTPRIRDVLLNDRVFETGIAYRELNRLMTRAG